MRLSTWTGEMRAARAPFIGQAENAGPRRESRRNLGRRRAWSRRVYLCLLSIFNFYRAHFIGRAPAQCIIDFRESAMDYVNSVRTGIKVSRICLGCMTYGSPGKWRPWVLDVADAAMPFFRQAMGGRHQLLRHRGYLFARSQRRECRARDQG